MRKRLYIQLACFLAAGAVAAGSAEAATTVLSTNWSGYAVTTKSGAKFRKASGTWVVKQPDCSTRSPGYSASWVGVGGFGDNAQKLEQTGTDADCSASGKPRFRAWYELLPAPGHNIPMTVHAGDKMSASVQVQGSSVTIRMRNRTTDASFSKTTTMSSPDVTSAEWIVEAPSSCDDNDNCFLLPLSDFGTVPFSSATAFTGNGNGKSISSTSFSVFKLRMRTKGGGAALSDGATASKLSSGGSTFSVTYRRQVERSSKRARTLARSAAH